MSAITTHVLDTSRGRPAAGIVVVLEQKDEAANDAWREIGRGTTDDDGRVKTLLAPGVAPGAGVHRLTFDTAAWFEAQHVAAFYPEVCITFTIIDPAQHHHVPLLLSPFGYSTYRGS